VNIDPTELNAIFDLTDRMADALKRFGQSWIGSDGDRHMRPEIVALLDEHCARHRFVATGVAAVAKEMPDTMPEDPGSTRGGTGEVRSLLDDVIDRDMVIVWHDQDGAA
jgi:hypothetical protein